MYIQSPSTILLGFLNSQALLPEFGLGRVEFIGFIWLCVFFEVSHELLLGDVQSLYFWAVEDYICTYV